MKKSILLTLFIVTSLLTAKAQYAKIYNFDATASGKAPLGNLVSNGGVLYGMTSSGGANTFGVVFKINPDGSGYTKLLDFDNAGNGRKPAGALICDGTFLYGMTERGGANNLGVIFKIKTDGTGYSKLFDFDGAANGNYPLGSLISVGGFLYGMTSYGGAHNYGVIFKIMPDGTGFTKLLDFDYVPNGGTPQGTLIYDGTFLYGITEQGGATASGVVFKVMPDGTAFTKIHEFAGTLTNGGNTNGSIVSDGTYVYGMVPIGGVNNVGAIFKLKLDGTGYTQFFDFTGTINGIHADLIINGGALYGLTSYDTSGFNGSIFTVNTDGTGFTKLHKFTGGSGTFDGNGPMGSLISDGMSLYGMTQKGGNTDDGTIFRYQLATNGIAEHIDETDVTVYPNPTYGKFTVKNKEAGSYTVDVYNMLGAKVYSGSEVNQISKEINLSNAPKGIYFVKIYGGVKSYATKIILQ